MNLVMDFLAREWVKLYKTKPLTTISTTIVFAGLFAGIITFLDQIDRDKRERKRLENLDYQSQIQQLGQMEENIKQLLNFVDNQKKSLQETEDTISNLKTEKEKLQPLVETDRAIVEALFRAQEERASSNIWRERWIGFGFGLAASLIASFIWLVISILIKNSRSQSTTNPS